jgi:hypothetical protein
LAPFLLQGNPGRRDIILTKRKGGYNEEKEKAEKEL